MLDFFTIFSKGGLVLWCFQGVSDSCTGPVNALIRSVLLQVPPPRDQNSRSSLPDPRSSPCHPIPFRLVVRARQRPSSIPERRLGFCPPWAAPQLYDPSVRPGVCG